MASIYPPQTRESILSGFGETDAQAWLYYKTAFVSTARGKFRRGPKADSMRMSVRFTIYSETLARIEEELEDDDFMAGRFVMFDVLVEGDVRVNPGSWLRERRASLMIDCNEVMVQLGWNKYGGLLGGGTPCKSQMLPGKLENLYRRRDLRIVARNFVN